MFPRDGWKRRGERRREGRDAKVVKGGEGYMDYGTLEVVSLRRC